MSSSPRPVLPGPDRSGLLLVDKPLGVTSHDVVAHARRRLGIRSVGHLGTLDPGASGLLVLATGAATRCAMVWQGGQKTYAGTARFGVTTDSQDTTGTVLSTSPLRPSEEQVRAAASTLTGDLLQVPPMVSAIKQDGERLYALARRGETVERAPRPVRVETWRWLGFAAGEARFELDCSGGTYVRTLVHDLGERVGCGAALAALRRLRSAPFHVEQACTWSDLDAWPPVELFARFSVPLDRALEVLPAIVLDDAAAERIGHGQAPVVIAGSAPMDAGPRSVVLRTATGRALALAELCRTGDGVQARPSVVFPWAVREGKAS
jgi:tRNA pseudouridine55 synthase